jgi:hypothetical protein
MKKIIDMDTLMNIIKDVENQDTVDWSSLPVDEHVVTQVLALDIVEQFENNWIENFSLEELHYIMLATIIKLITENFALNAILYTGRNNDAKSS